LSESDTYFTLAELGAGYGRLGYVMLKTAQCQYFVFDIPPALYLSQWYLTTLFPKRRAFRFRRFDTFETPSRERFDLINPGFFERVYRRDQPPS
jgi:putative sugar O-methyltransferase